MQHIPQLPGSRSVPVQAAEGVMVTFTLREATVGDLKVPGFAEAMGNIVNSVAAMGMAQKAVKDGGSLAAFVAPLGDYSIALCVLARADAPDNPKRPNGQPWRVEDLPIEALSPLIGAFDEINLTEGKVRALSTLVPAMALRLRAAMGSSNGSPSGPGSTSTNSSAPGTPSPSASLSPSQD